MSDGKVSDYAWSTGRRGFARRHGLLGDDELREDEVCWATARFRTLWRRRRAGELWVTASWRERNSPQKNVMKMERHGWGWIERKEPVRELRERNWWKVREVRMNSERSEGWEGAWEEWRVRGPSEEWEGEWESRREKIVRKKKNPSWLCLVKKSTFFKKIPLKLYCCGFLQKPQQYGYFISFLFFLRDILLRTGKTAAIPPQQ